MFPERFETNRTILERLSRDNVDVPRLYRRLDADDPDVRESLRYLPWEPHDHPQETLEWVREAERRWEEGDRATYRIRSQEPLPPGETAGIVYLDPFWDRRSAEIVIWLRKPFWGEMLLPEISVELTELALLDLDLELLFAESFSEAEWLRERYQEYADAYGGTYEGLIRNKVAVGGEVKDVHRFSITREQYLEATGKDGESREYEPPSIAAE